MLPKPRLSGSKNFGSNTYKNKDKSQKQEETSSSREQEILTRVKYKRQLAESVRSSCVHMT